MAIDILNASIAMILTVLVVPFNLSNAQIGLGVMIYSLMGSLSQPYFGWLADRFGGRWLGALGLLWTAGFYFAATFAQSYFTLILLMGIASLGSGAFHPQGAMNASAAGRRRASTATSVFFFLGQMGLAFGPMIAGLLLENIGMLGPRLMAFAALPFVLWMALGLRRRLGAATDEERAEEPATAASIGGSGSQRWLLIGAFAVLVALRATVQQAYYGLLPKYLADLGFAPSEFGFMVGVFSVAVALGTMGGGILGDHYNQRKVLLWTLFASVPFSWLMLDLTSGWLFYALAFGAGFFVGAPHSILVVMTQRLLPQRQGLASGAILGFMFAAGAAGTGLAGWLADLTSLSAVIHAIALLPVIAGFCAFSLRSRRQTAPAIRPAIGSAD